jgi:hypothetical protein
LIVCATILGYHTPMSRRVSYQGLDTADGCFAVAVLIEPDQTVLRTGFTTHAEADEWIEGLRVLMAAVGAPVSLAFPEQPSSLPVDVLLFLTRKPSPEPG